MRSRELGAGLLRQWIVLVLGLVLTAGGAYVTLQLVPVSYRATAHVLLLPGQSTIPEDGNLFLHVGGTHPMRDIVSRSMMADEVATPLLEGRTDASYAVHPDSASAAPAIMVVAEGPSTAETLRTLDAVLEEVELTLAAIQDQLGVPPDAQITDMTISVDQDAEQVRSSTMRAVVAVVILGTVFTFVLAIWVDSLRTSRRAADRRDGGAPPAQQKISDPV